MIQKRSAFPKFRGVYGFYDIINTVVFTYVNVILVSAAKPWKDGIFGWKTENPRYPWKIGLMIFLPEIIYEINCGEIEFVRNVWYRKFDEINP